LHEGSGQIAIAMATNAITNKKRLLLSSPVKGKKLSSFFFRLPISLTEICALR